MMTEKRHSGEVPVEAWAFLGAVAVFLILLVLFFLYLNKKLCFKECGGFPCIEKPTKKQKKDNTLGSAYNYDNDNDTSSDSDDEVLRHYQQSIQRVPSSRSGNSRSKSSRQGEKEDLVASGKESERYSAVYDDAASQRTAAKDDTDGRRASAATGAAASSVRLEDERSSLHSSSQVSQEHQQHAAYSNEAYQREQDMSPTGVSHTSTEQANSAGYADTASMSVGDPDQDEHLFDVSDLNADQEPVLISKCGSLEVTFNFDTAHSRMTVDVHQARDIPSKDRGGANSTQVRLLLLPAKKLRHKTKIKQGESPEFQEKFTFKIQNEELNNMGMRFRLYGCERMRRERMIGESIVGFASINQDIETTHWLTLEPRSNLSHGDSKFDVSSLARSDSASSTQSMQHGGMPELLIGLAYNGTTGRLSVEVIKGSNFRNMAMNRAPDTYVKLTLMSPNGQEIARSKTSVRRGQPNPLYKETFMFQVALFQLPDVTLMVSVYNKRSMKRKEMIGWFSLGYNNSGEEELSHWTDMRESKGEQVCRWHVLLEA